ncbi:MAG: hypothetical protein HY554_01705 [Elusimicrobia bacterium]|nr:hypothetical protein [Elusimicrobiota bacterium]
MIALLLAAGFAAAAAQPPILIYGGAPDLPALEPGERLRDAPADAAGAEAAVPYEAGEEQSVLLAPSGAGAWLKTGSSLLLYDSSGTLVDEVGLGRWSDAGEGGALTRRWVRGGVSPDGRFAWSWEKTEVVKPGRAEQVLSSARLMRYLGTTGSELFRDELADAPEGLDPVVVSADGERALVCERGPDAWIVAVYDFTGNRLMDAHGKGSIEFAQLAPGGRYGLVRWHQLDQPPVYGVLDVDRRAQKTLSGARLTGAARVDDEGRLFVGDKLIAQPQ